MTILCIETSTSVCSVAVCKDGEVVEQRISREDGNHARLLPAFIQELLANSERTTGCPIDAVALSEGPGSYTGLRIGTSTAKGICYGLNLPLIPIPTLQVLCAAALSNQQSAISNHQSPLLCPMIDARRMEVYTALYDSHVQRLSEVKAVVVDSAASIGAPTETVCYFGDGAAKCQSVLAAPQWQFIPDIVPEAQYMGRLAEAMPNGKWVTDKELAYYEPFYLKEFVAAQSHVKGLK